jgi:hypothetical protein
MECALFIFTVILRMNRDNFCTQRHPVVCEVLTVSYKSPGSACYLLQAGWLSNLKKEAIFSSEMFNFKCSTRRYIQEDVNLRYKRVSLL